MRRAWVAALSVSLPKYVIEHGTQLKHYLCPNGWTPHRGQAFSFDSELQGQDWIAEARKTAPLMFVHHVPRVIAVELRSKEPTMGGTYTHDYDPFGFENLRKYLPGSVNPIDPHGRPQRIGKRVGEEEQG